MSQSFSQIALELTWEPSDAVNLASVMREIPPYTCSLWGLVRLTISSLDITPKISSYSDVQAVSPPAKLRETFTSATIYVCNPTSFFTVN